LYLNGAIFCFIIPFVAITNTFAILCLYQGLELAAPSLGEAMTAGIFYFILSTPSSPY
jgi:hypothetical protein